ncbi:MAG: HEAT repeat domain-containing protein [Phycisphaerales bacterium]|nr:HEAT repeat domain-containing protein [Phycisphaerales bacterium]
MVGLPLLAPSAALAQTATIPANIITKTAQLTPDEVRTVNEYAEQAARNLSSTDPDAIRTARERILSPFSTRGMGVPFRLAYSNAVCPVAERLTTNDDELIAVNALRVLGEVGTDRSLNAIERSLDHPAVAVRYTAAYALLRTFEALSKETPAVSPDKVQSLLTRLGEMIRNEEDPWILDVSVRALIAASKINRQNFEAIPAAAIQQLAEATGNRVRTIPAYEENLDRLTFMLRATVACRDALTDTGRPLPAGAARAAAGLSGDVLAFAVARVESGVESQEERDLLRSLVRSAQASMFFAATAINPSGTQTPPEQIDPTSRNFVEQANREIQKLHAVPYSFPRGRFDRA